jgi:hypothetical protein
VSVLINRRKEVNKKFNTTPENSYTQIPNIDFSKIKVGMKNLDDAIYQLGDFKRINPRYADKEFVLKTIYSNNTREMKNISNCYYKISGIYSRLCRYMAFLYRYDWIITPYIDKDSNIKNEKILKTFNKALLYLDEFEPKRFFGEVALKVIKNGCYYGYKVFNNNKISIQELPLEYCRSRFSVNGKPAVEFNMRFFDDYFADTAQRMKMLNLFPAEFKKGYSLFKDGKLAPDFANDETGWYLLDTENTIKFNLNNEDYPIFMSTIPAIIDLDAAQALDRKKMAQKLLKIIIQKLPLDKNGDLIFDPDEVKDLHNNAVKMLGRAIGIDVLTTFADVDVADMSDNNTTTTVDELNKVERTVYNESGTAQNLFNTDGNLALEKSILNDEATIWNLVCQFEAFLNELLNPFNKNSKKFYFRVQILPTTIYNYKDMAKLYKEQVQLGYSKMLPQIALGQSQSSILANAYFENEVLDLVNLFIPPLMSSTMSSNTVQTANSGEVGRKEKEDSEKSDKTIANKESMS